MAQLTIINYHYIRDFPNTRYNRIKGLLVSEFRKHLDYIQQNYIVVSMKQVIDGAELPNKACLLAFDDGLIDHYLTVQALF